MTGRRRRTGRMMERVRMNKVRVMRREKKESIEDIWRVVFIDGVRFC